MTSSRSARIGVPLGVAASVLAVVLVSVLDGGTPAPPRLPIGLSAGGDATMGESDAAAGAPGSSRAYSGKVTYRYAEGALPSPLPDEAAAYTLQGERASSDDVARLASAVGLDGAAPVREDGSWVVRVDGRELRVHDSPGLPWYYSPYARCAVAASDGTEPAVTADSAPECKPVPDQPPPPPGSTDPGSTDPGSTEPGSTEPEDPAKPAEPRPAHPSPGGEPQSDPDGSSSGGGTDGSTGTTTCSCPPDVKCDCGFVQPTPVALPPESEARAVANRVVEASGQSVELRAERGYDAWYFSGDVSVAGMRAVGFGVHVTIDPKGDVREASGHLGTAEAAATYPLLTPQEASERSGMFYGRPAIACDADVPECDVEEREIVRDVDRVELGLLFAPAMLRDSDEKAAYLVPAWLFFMEDSAYPEAMLALSDEYIAQPEPAADDDPRTCDPAAGCDTPVDQPANVVEPVPPAKS